MDFLKDLSIDKVRNLAEDTLNQVKPKTDVEARVYEVLSHKNWGSSSSLMHEVARDTRDMERFHVITRLMWDSWRVVFKALTLLEFLVKNGAERCVDDARNHGHVLRALGQFNYYEGTVDRGVGVREKSKQILEILGDDERIREERQKARKLREKFNGSQSTAASTAQTSGYGNQDSWNTGNDGGGGGGGYGDSGIDSGYDNGGGYSGRYGGSKGAPSAAVTPTFAAMPDDSRKKKSKKKGTKKKMLAATPPPVAQPEIDLFSFDDAPAPAAPAGSDDFGAFQSTPAPTPAPVKDEFADFGSLRSAPAAQPDPFVAAPAPTAPQQQSFDAFGNMPVASGGMNMGGMAMNTPNNSAVGAPGMAGINNAFGNMTMGAQPSMAPVAPVAVADDEFGDFADAAQPSPVKRNPGDPMAKLVSLDHLSKNPSQPKPQSTFGQAAGAGQNNQFMQNAQPANAMAPQPVMVSAGGSDAISSMMGPPPAQPQMPKGVPQGMQPGMQPGVQQQAVGQAQTNPNMMHQMNPQMMQQGMTPQMMQANMGSGGQGMTPQMMQQMQMQMMQQGMNPNMMQGNMGMGNQGMMGNQGGMNQMGMQGMPQSNMGIGNQGHMGGQGMQGGMNFQQQQWR
eukprot:CAMPEP_0117037444 /NCGR_PEP_ID=MMETSP0472-20121206/26431_1 /TAXON_ID=693140 ORGANISM="Tiarina fusus, Strain LIS" /NCGR_SAMPLE_ID=MMETSP0472 /ASSEMBLY_ACC=CAM_ASM_000603 /LENGTH=620 /DNA_ID=CAMNT_0004747433 /DNA_START=69 /DNA_END=1927 /DNA_ORIENTATION=-